MTQFVRGAIAAVAAVGWSPAPAVEPAAPLVVAHKWDDSVGFYDPATGDRHAVVSVGRRPHEMAMSADGRFAYVTLYGIDLFTETAEGGRAVAVLDLAERAKVGEIDLGKYRRPHGIEAGRSGRLYVTCDHPPALLVLDPDRRAVAAAIELPDAGALPHMVVVAPDERRAYVANCGTGTVAVIDVPGRTVLAQLPVGGIPMGMALTADGGTLFATNRTANGVAVIDAKAAKVRRVLEISGHPVRVRLTAGDKWLLVTLIDAGELAAVDVPELVVRKRIPIGSRVEGVLADPAGRFGYASAQADDKVVRFSIGDWKTVREIKTGRHPDPLLLIPETGPETRKGG